MVFRIVYTRPGEEKKQTQKGNDGNGKVETKVEMTEMEKEKDKDEDSGFSLFKKKRSFSSAPKAESLPVASRETQCPIDERD